MVVVPVVDPAELVSALTIADVVMADPVEVAVTVLDGEVTIVVAVVVATDAPLLVKAAQ